MAAASPKISVLVPTFNHGKTIARSILSALSQDYADFELLISDNASTDNTQEIVRPLAQKDSRIKYILQEKNIGVVNNANFLIEKARGEYVVFLHADDVLGAHFLSTSVKLLDANPSAGLSFSLYNTIDLDDKPSPARARNRFSGPSRLIPSKQAFEALLDRDYLVFCSTMARKSVFEKCGMFDPEIVGPNDYYLWLKIASKFDFVFNSGATCSYRVSDLNGSNYLVDNNILHMEQYKFIRRLFDSDLPKTPQNAEYCKKMLRNTSMGLLRHSIRSMMRGNGRLARSQCALSVAVYDGKIQLAIAAILYTASLFTFILSPILLAAVPVAISILSRLRIWGHN